jgi:ATP-dependent DNA helicase UvrD/PcrA
VVGVGPERVDAALALPGVRHIQLPDVSHRDPTNILPAAAAAIRQRDFDHDAVKAALDSGMLEMRHHHDPSDEGALVAALVRELRDAGHESVGIFSHHVDATASLSDHLNGEGIAHEIVGLPDSVTSALQAQFEMLCYASGHGTTDAIRRALGVFVTSTERGKSAPGLARMIAGQRVAPATLSARLQQLESSLASATSVPEVLDIVAQVPNGVGLTRGGRAWDRSTRILRALLGPRLCRAATFPPGGFDFLRERMTDEQVSLLTYSDAGDPADVQLMGLYQSKGREADATIVVLRGNDYYGGEAEPMPVGSKLLYVVLTRARTKTIVLTLGSTLPSLIYPLAVLSATSTA